MVDSFLRDIIGDWFTWTIFGGILISWGVGVADIIKYGWSGEGGE